MKMEHLWAPWRMKYILSEKSAGCILCDKPKENNDRENLILRRGKRCFVIMNLYPYNNGHLMVAPYKHVESLEMLDEQDLLEMMLFTQKATSALNSLMSPEGYNIGFNLGKVAGAGIHEHLHLHVVPRWVGDCNFMPVVSDCKVINEHINETYDKILKAAEKIF